MNRTITTRIALFFGIAATLQTQAQVTVETFDTFTLTPNSYYKNTTTNNWQTSEADFEYKWNTGGSYWQAGCSYTNVKDTVDGTYTNLYGNITNSGFSGNNYVTVQDPSVIKINHLSVVSGFFITNTTFAWKTIKKGNQFSRKFGDTTGTGSGTSIPQGEYKDWFLLKVVGYRNGLATNDTIKFYLADYRPAGTANDFVIKNWQFVNCTQLGIVDSIRFHLSSSDNSFGFMNTPAYFSIDNFTTSTTVGLHELANISNISLFPNPSNENALISYHTAQEATLTVRMFDISGKEVMHTVLTGQAGPNMVPLETSLLESGAYFVNISDGSSSKIIKFIKL
jgi:hypothetical protein